MPGRGEWSRSSPRHSRRWPGRPTPQGDKTLRKDDHQAFLRKFIFDIKGGKHHIVEVVPKEKTTFPPACKFA